MVVYEKCSICGKKYFLTYDQYEKIDDIFICNNCKEVNKLKSKYKTNVGNFKIKINVINNLDEVESKIDNIIKKLKKIKELQEEINIKV